jgi:hypothetical protein
MTKLIVEMEMPRDCWCCTNGHADWIYNDDGAAQMVCFCNICNTEEDDKWISETETERPSWCPIVGVLPDEHGDLVDRSLLCADLVGVILSHRGLGIDEVIARQPAIIAAERKDDGNI